MLVILLYLIIKERINQSFFRMGGRAADRGGREEGIFLHKRDGLLGRWGRGLVLQAGFSLKKY
jgi:hypothetical protein